mmetsp:Transcript_21922/g.60932  ORF Transcript_21922/g.60932 Transcript_21922/m.60932 type:complete len:115 (-) Transcript_21922:436-780(-)
MVANRVEKQFSDATSLKQFLRNRGWSLPEEAQPICDRQSHGLVLARNPNAVSGNTKSIADPREGDLVRRRALNLLESIMCQWASPMESSTASRQRTRGGYRVVLGDVLRSGVMS